MALGDTFSLIQRVTIPNGPTSQLLKFLLPAGEIDSVRVKLFGANASDDVKFNFDVGSGGMFTTELTVASGTDEIEATSVGETVTNDQFGVISIDSPFTSGALSGVTDIGVHVTYVTQSVNLTGNQTVAGDKTFTGATDFGGATSLEIPNSATPTVNADGEIAVDTSVADFSHGIVKVYAGEELGVVAMPVAEFTSPTDGHVVAYNATNDEFELVAQSGGGVDTANSPNAGEWAKFTDADTIEGRTNSELIADLSLEIGVDVQAHDDFLDDIAALTDPNADRLLFWDDSVGAVAWLTVGTNLSITDDTISASLAGGAVDTANSPNAGEYARFVDADTIEGRTESEFKADMNLEIGVDVQAWDAQLDTWAGITPGANVGTFLATPSSANLAAAVTDETGSGALVFGTAPTLSNPKLDCDASAASDDTYSGITISGRNNSGGVTQWDAVYINGSSEFVIADANGSGTYPAIGLAVSTETTGNPVTVLVRGTVRNDAWTWTVGGVIYLSTTAGGLTQTAPSTSGDKVQVMGIAISADEMLVNPSPDYITIT